MYGKFVVKFDDGTYEDGYNPGNWNTHFISIPRIGEYIESADGRYLLCVKNVIHKSDMMTGIAYIHIQVNKHCCWFELRIPNTLTKRHEKPTRFEIGDNVVVSKCEPMGLLGEVGKIELVLGDNRYSVKFDNDNRWVMLGHEIAHA